MNVKSGFDGASWTTMREEPGGKSAHWFCLGNRFRFRCGSKKCLVRRQKNEFGIKGRLWEVCEVP